MLFTRRDFLGSVAAAGLCSATPARAATYPSKQIKIVLPSGPGSLVDFAGRFVANAMSTSLNQVVIPENVSGAAGILGTEQIARSAPDGHTLGVVSSNHAINPSLYKIKYSPTDDFTAVAILGASPMVLCVNPSLAITTVDQLIAQAKAEPGKLSYGSPGVGSISHLSGELFASTSGASWLHVPYKASDRYIADLIAGHIDAGFVVSASAIPLIRSGRLRALAVSTVARTPMFPNIPTLQETGLSGFSVEAWVAMIGPAGLPASITELVNSEVRRALSTQEAKDKFATQGVDIVASTPEEARRVISEDIERYAKIVAAVGIRPE